MNRLRFENDGPSIVASDYWQSNLASAGKLYLSMNAGCFRLLIPEIQRAVLADMRRGAKHIVVSMLPKEKWREREFCVEWMVEDGSDTPWSCQLSPGQVDRAPNHEDVGKEWRGSVWDIKKGHPHKCLERPAYYQIVPELPWLRKITK